VLGWSNADKLRTLRDEREGLEQRLGDIGLRIANTQRLRGQCQAQLEALAKLEVFTRYSEIDWQAPAREIARLTEERDRLKAASDTLRELESQLAQVVERLKEIEGDLGEAQGKRGEIRSKHETAQAQHAQALEIHDASRTRRHVAAIS